jgi:quercetin dioxygenase-like cupin family protein
MNATTNAPAVVHMPPRAQRWEKLPFPGVSVAVLREHARERTVLLRMDAGARYPMHTHPAGEQLLVLSGDVDVGGQSLAEGDYLYTPPDGRHAAATRGGCLLFITLPVPIEIVEPGSA